MCIFRTLVKFGKSYAKFLSSMSSKISGHFYGIGRAPPRASEGPWSLSFISFTVYPSLQKYIYNITLCTYIPEAASHSCVHGRATGQGRCKSNVVPAYVVKTYGDAEVELSVLFSCAGVGGGSSASHAGRFLPGEHNAYKLNRIGPKGRSGRFGEGKSSHNIMMSEKSLPLL